MTNIHSPATLLGTPVQLLGKQIAYQSITWQQLNAFKHCFMFFSLFVSLIYLDKLVYHLIQVIYCLSAITWVMSVG